MTIRARTVHVARTVLLSMPRDAALRGNGADLISAVAAMSTEERTGLPRRGLRRIKAAARRDHRPLWARSTGARTIETKGRPRRNPGRSSAIGVSAATARALRAGGREGVGPAPPRRSLCEGEISFDKVRALADVATPESDRGLCDEAKGASVRELAEVARSERRAGSDSLFVLARVPSTMGATCASTMPTAPSAPSCRPSPMPRPRPRMDAQPKQIPSDGETPWDQRRCDAFLGIDPLPVQARRRPPSHHDQPLRRRGPRPPGRPGRRVRRAERPGRRARARRPDRRRDGQAHRL